MSVWNESLSLVKLEHRCMQKCSSGRSMFFQSKLFVPFNQACGTQKSKNTFKIIQSCYQVHNLPEQPQRFQIMNKLSSVGLRMYFFVMNDKVYFCRMISSETETCEITRVCRPRKLKSKFSIYPFDLILFRPIEI